jgi:hypothetical protein
MAGKASSQNAGILAGVPSSPRIRLWISQAARRLSRAVCRTPSVARRLSPSAWRAWLHHQSGGAIRGEAGAHPQPSPAPPVIGAAPLPGLPAIGVGFRQGPAGGSAGCGNEEKGTGDVCGGLESARPGWIHFHDCCRSADQSVQRSNGRYRCFAENSPARLG